MKWKWKVAILMLAVLLAVDVMLLWNFNQEPAYRGRTLSDWLEEYADDVRRLGLEEAPPKTNEAYYAISAIGTNALPTLLRWVAQKPGWQRQQLEKLIDKLPDAVAESGFVRNFPLRDRRPGGYLAGFLVLGKAASGAVPELSRLMRAPDAPENGMDAAIALSDLAPDGLAPLIAAAEDPHARCRSSAIMVLGEMGAYADVVLPVLNRLRDNPDEKVRQDATIALGRINEYQEAHRVPAP